MNPGCYLLIGDDNWSKNQYIDNVKQEVLDNVNDMMNLLELYDKEVIVETVIEATETLPFFAEKKLIILHETGLFRPGRKDDSEKFEKLLQNLPDYVVIIINDKEVDKRSRLYKLLKKENTTVEFGFPDEQRLCTLLEEKSFGLTIKRSVLSYFIQNMPQDMNYIFSEWDKLISYANNKDITKVMVDQICVFSLEVRVFELVKKIVDNKSTEALSIYQTMLQSKESPIGILVLVARQYRIMYKAKYLVAKGVDRNTIAGTLKLPAFVAREVSEKVSKYSFEQLERLIEECMITDKDIKTGRRGPNEGVELLIIKCINVITK